MILRPATGADAAAVAEIYLAARSAALPTIRWAHTDDEVRAWVAGQLVPAGGVIVAERDGVVLGHIGIEDEWVDHLYLHPSAWRQAIGSRLIEHAKALRPSGLRLWCFQVNMRARAFYEHHGFVAAQFTDGADNEEREPDLLYVWRQPDGLA